MFTLKNVIMRVASRSFSSSLPKFKENTDPIQESLLSEKCFLVDEKDRIIGQASKRDCHLIQKNGDIPLHRAFSVFLFNEKGHLLLQKRSSQKITYPDMYTNSCCSHPVADFPGEDEEKNAIGVKRAAQRRLNYELGIPVEKMPLEEFSYLTRIHYKDEGNGKWGEHEIDYILFLQINAKITPNSNEISEISYVPRNELDNFIPTITEPLTPWFQMILKHRLKHWWDHLNDLDEVKEQEKILHLKI